MEKLGIDWQAKKAEFEAYLEEVKQGRQNNLYDPRRRITSGPGYSLKQEAIGLATMTEIPEEKTPLPAMGGGLE